MAHQVFTAGHELEDQELQLLTPRGLSLNAHIVDVEATAFDHVIRTFADFPTPVAGVITLTSGNWALAAPISVGVNTVLVPLGTTVYLTGLGWTNVLSGEGPVLEVRGNLLAEALAVNATVSDAVLLSAIGATARLVECRLSAAAGSCIVVSQAQELELIGGELTGALIGLEIDGDINWIRLTSVAMTGSVDTGVDYVSGAVDFAKLGSCQMSCGVSGIDWAAANIPAFGLVVEGSSMNTGAPFVGFDELSARVTLRGNYESGSQLDETPIFPAELPVFDHVVAALDDLPAAAGGFIDLTSGSWAITGTFALGADVLRVAAGVSAFVKGIGPEKVLTGRLLVNGTLVAESLTMTSADNTVEVVGTLRATGCHFISTGVGIVNQCVLANNAAAILDFEQVNITSNTHGCLRCLNAAFIRCIGGTWTGSVASVNGFTQSNPPGRFELSHIRGLNLDVFIDRASGTGTWAGVFDCIVDCAQGVNWTAASVPVDGMVIMGNYFNTATAFVGFTAASAGFICRGNSGSAGLLTETALVP
jgi:hypothetical protein